ncbi:CotH kinase family protein [bacterium]|nr:CotH kinase family protein [bacterium]
MASHYGIANAIGDFTTAGDRLSNGSERITLLNNIGVVVDAVRYSDEPPWPIGPDQTGQSLECLDPDSDNSRPENWRTSRIDTTESETTSQWQYIEVTGNATSQQIYFYINGPGEWLVDQIVITPEGGGPNILPNGSFDPDDSGWLKTGNHAGSYRTIADKHDGIGCEHIVSTGIGGSSSNSLNRDVPSMTVGQNYTISCWFKYLSGHETLTFRLSSSTETSGIYQTVTADGVEGGFPASPSVNDEYFPHLGTPGLVNSISSDGIPPFIHIDKMTHSPAKPTSTDSVTITAEVSSAETIMDVTLHYEAFIAPYQDPNQVSALTMFDDGSHGDSLAGDGTYGVTIPALNSQTLLRYRIEVTDSSDRSWTWPDEGEPNPNKAYFVYNGEENTNAQSYFLLIPQENLDYLLANVWSHKYVEATLVAEGIVYDHIGIHLRGQGWRTQPKKGWKIAFNNTEYLRDLSRLDLVMHMPVQQKVVNDLFWSMGQGNLATEVVRYYINGSFYGVFLAQESPSSSSLKRRGMDDTGEIFKANAIDWPYGSYVLSSDLDYYDPAVYPDAYPKLYEKKSDALGSFQSLIDLTYLFAQTPEAEIYNAMANTIELDEWFYKWAINVCGPNFDIMGSNYTIINPVEPDLKWQWISHDYTHFFASAYNFDPYVYYGYFNKWQERTINNPALSNRFLVILDDVLQNYNIVENLCTRLDEAYEKYEEDINDEIALGYGGSGPFVLTYSQKESIKSSFATRCNWLANSWLPGKSYTPPANEHPTILLNDPILSGNTINIQWTYHDPESDTCKVDLYWTDMKWSYFVPIEDANDIPAEQGSFLWSQNLPADYVSHNIYIHAVIRDDNSELVGRYTTVNPLFIPENCETIWDHGYGLSGDLNQNCYVDLEDLSALIANWTENNDPGTTSGDRWDFWEDLAFSSNPNGVWSYGASPKATNPNQPDTSTLILFTDNIIGTSGVPCPWWHYIPIRSGMVPCVYKNTTTGDVYGCPPGMAALHGACDTQEMGVARWTAPAAGEFIIQGAFYSGNTGRCDYYVIHNFTSVLYSELDSSFTSEFNLLVELNSGDTIDFAVGTGTDDCGADTTPLTATIAEPSCDNIGIYLDGDVNKDCIINLQDFTIIANDWLLCNDPADSNCSLVW